MRRVAAFYSFKEEGLSDQEAIIVESETLHREVLSCRLRRRMAYADLKYQSGPPYHKYWSWPGVWSIMGVMLALEILIVLAILALWFVAIVRKAERESIDLLLSLLRLPRRLLQKQANYQDRRLGGCEI